MKVLIITNNFGGLYSFRREVVSAIINQGHDVFIAAPFDTKTDFFIQMSCHVVDMQFDRKGINPLKDLRLLLRYIKLLKEIRPDSVLSYTIKPNLYGGMACRICKIPQIANITGLGSAVENPGLLQKITIVLYKIGLYQVKTVFFQNKSNLFFCEQHKMVKGRKLLIPGSGVNLQYHSFQEYPEEQPLRFIFISRLLKEKGFEDYCSVAEIIKRDHPNVEFHVVGPSEDQYEEKLNQLQSNNVIIYHGPQADVRPFIGMCHCTIHPSYYPEGMSNVLLESCAAGRPIITTDRPGCGEIVEEGETGFLVRAKDVDNIVDVINKFINLSYSKKVMMGLKARKKVEKEFDRNIVIRAYLEEINSI